MSEQWQGRHNPDRHTVVAPSEAVCRVCRDACTPDEDGLCHCCLRQEVDSLRATVQRVRQLHVIELAADEESEMCRECGFMPTVGDEVCPTIRILDGGDDE